MFQGSMVALVTPMNEDDSIDETSLRHLVDYHIDNQTDGIVAVGTTGESATLNHNEHCEVVRIVVEQVAGRVPVIAGTGSNSTAEAIDYTRCAVKAGADACLLVTPYYNKPTQEGLYQHYKKVAETVPVPQLLYNVPGRTACDMLPATVKRLAEIDNIIGIKEAVGDVTRMRELVAYASDQFAIYSGDDATVLELIRHGGKGAISVTANVAPRAMHDMLKMALAGDSQGAEKINQRLMGLHKNLFVEANPIPVKWAVHTLGLISPAIRLPLTPLSEKYHDVVKQAMQQAQVL
ncbi:MAG: 4-hydroxy-tetrahydrodipicolinate synthase [Gammaproteobacteria bacterium]|nr:MAG: 4-hydroxy-tetrahydrodipicolinate synthase [Gammaproteobacteria bacterium]RKZ41558.1 MAG: 4-hydroxy-tetrahydrodipicolinate synthase [Gammaproteobacteria bacterium]RKZ76257.1 MAG: 4-hydroxy-tetrahydrodipicolinate synthase [Gammaproteobacteria bacterium]